MNRIVLFIVSFFLIINLYAQDFPIHTQYMYNKTAINPGFLGVKGKVALLLMHRSQWMHIEGAPSTSDFAFEYPFEKTAFGMGINYDQFGPITKFTGNFQFSYNLELSYATFLSLGINAGVFQNQFDIDKLSIKDVDEDIFLNSADEFDLNVGTGAFMYSELWYLGLSIPNLNLQRYYKNKLSQFDKRPFHLYFMGGYNMDIGKGMMLQPSLLFRYAQHIPVSTELSLNLQWNETLTTGLAYRLNAAYSLLIGINVSRQLHIGYAFDWDQSEIRLENYGSHEILLRYYISKDENSLRYQSPRFF